MSAEQKRGGRTPEFSSFIGATTLDVAGSIVCLRPMVSQVQLLPYLHREGATFTKPPIILTRDEFIKGAEARLVIARLKKGWDMALDSRVWDADGNLRHFPMMDLHPKKTPENTEMIGQILKRDIAPKFGGGFLLTSGESYQFLGKELLKTSEWLEFLNCFLIADLACAENSSLLRVASHKYVGRCRIQNHGCLRITANGEKKVIPTVIAVI
jgi:hypothetical protein